MFRELKHVMDILLGSLHFSHKTCKLYVGPSDLHPTDSK